MDDIHPPPTLRLEAGVFWLIFARFEDGGFMVNVEGVDYDVTTIGYAIEQWRNENGEWEIVGCINDQ